ncbi:MAG: ATP-binding protein [Planctomycetaceae bacterium]|jgi:energy-coupling factor transporter ATP-binding protein EcfA2|nr:ATP-binding protein [Planctomycetaceae bacterium]
MSKYITIHIEDFVQIRKADIELAPLTLFVGDNNSGKSYLASLIWGILNYNFFQFFDKNIINDKNISPFQKLYCWFHKSFKHNSDSPIHWKITKEFHQSIITLINKILDNRKKEFIRDILCSDSDIDIGHITFDFPFDDELSFTIERDHLRNSNNRYEQHILFYITRNGKCISRTLVLGINNDTVEEIPLWFLCEAYSSAYIKNRVSFINDINDDVSFFPASRTGFLLTYRSLIDESLEQRFNLRGQGDKNYHLTSPQVSFIRSIANLKEHFRKIKKSDDINSIIDFIENKMIHGKISLSDTPLPDILYCPKNGVTIPMYLSSGVVTEISPLLACLKYRRIGNYCIIEEPEMSLHPELQWKMAQVLIRLANTSRFILTSTHSDIIIQHVNNMIKLSSQKNGEELAEDHGYDKSDIISPDCVRMYQFDVNLKDHSTNVTALKYNRNGFIVPTFGKTLRQLRNEVYDFQHEIDDTETKEE